MEGFFISTFKLNKKLQEQNISYQVHKYFLIKKSMKILFITTDFDDII